VLQLLLLLLGPRVSFCAVLCLLYQLVLRLYHSADGAFAGLLQLAWWWQQQQQ
jgi:hypothetical protein